MSQILFIIIFIISVVNGDLLVRGRCGRPGLPPKAFLHQISLDRSRFDDKETVLVRCDKEEFPPIRQTRVCRNGEWTGDKARCGKNTDVQVISFQVFDCHSSHSQTPLLSQNISQSPESELDLYANAFHSSRVSNETILSASGSDCYSWQIKLSHKVAIAFLLIDIFTPLNTTLLKPTLTVSVNQYRDCALKKRSSQTVYGDEVIGYYHFCDLKSEDDYNRELNNLSDTILVRVNTSVPQEIGLEAVFVGTIYTTTSASNKKIRPDCGELEVQRAGVLVQKETTFYNVRCNDSFHDYWLKPNYKYKFTCNYNGEWIGEWPTCVPMVACPKEEIIDEKSPNMDIEEIGNVYYLNSSHWFAINQTWVRYVCNDENEMMIGKSERVCQSNGKWTYRQPYCGSARLSVLAIFGILIAAILIFALIVFIVFRVHFKRVNRELQHTQNKLEASVSFKRASQECYAEIRDSNLYDSVTNANGKAWYETVSYENDLMPLTTRYESTPNKLTICEPVYLVMN